MGKLFASVACVALFLAGCDSGGTRIPVGPSQATPAPPIPAPPTPGNPFAETYTEISVGELVEPSCSHDRPSVRSLALSVLQTDSTNHR